VASPDVKKDFSLSQRFRLKAPTSLVEEIDLHLAADNEEELLSWLDIRPVSEKMGVCGDRVTRRQSHETDLEGPIGFGDEFRARLEIVRGENQGIGLVVANHSSHELPFLRIEISSS
jgi:hypothetical protein